LQAFAAVHPLLRFRIFRLWRLFNNPANFAKELALSAKRTEWHLYRIYRARNLIVHEGQEIENVPQLIENLHYYFSTTLSRILHGMWLNNEWDVADSIEHWRTKYEYIKNGLEIGNGKMLKISDFFPSYSKQLSQNRIWP
jgi:hypothetical protein